MKNWINKHWFVILMTILLSIIPMWIIAEVIHYNCEKDSKVYVEWTVYNDNGTCRTYSGTYEMKGTEFGIRNYWRSAGRYGGSYRSVNIIDKGAWGGYINKQAVCIYTGMNDVEVNTIKVLETK